MMFAPVEPYRKHAAAPLCSVAGRVAASNSGASWPPLEATWRSTIKSLYLGYVRDLVEKHLPAQYRHKPTWQHVSKEIVKAADGEKDLLEICVALRLVLALEGVKCLMN